MKGLGLPLFLLGLAIGNPATRKMLIDSAAVVSGKIEEEVKKAMQQVNPAPASPLVKEGEHK